MRFRQLFLLARAAGMVSLVSCGDDDPAPTQSTGTNPTELSGSWLEYDPDTEDVDDEVNMILEANGNASANVYGDTAEGTWSVVDGKLSIDWGGGDTDVGTYELDGDILTHNDEDDDGTAHWKKEF
jgi:hypothetical protein